MDQFDRDDEEYYDDDDHLNVPEAPTEDEPDFYALLNVEKTASAQDIRESYRHLAVLFHPDRHPAEHRDAAAKRFQDIVRAYEVLSDENQRRIYDTVGVRGLQAEWAVGRPLRTAEEIRAQFERYDYLRRQYKAKNEYHSMTVVSCGLDARGIFEPSGGFEVPFAPDFEDEEDGMETDEDEDEDDNEAPGSEHHDGSASKGDSKAEPVVDNELEEDVLPLLAVSSLKMLHSTQIPIAPQFSATLLATAGIGRGRATANVLGTAQYQFSNEVLVKAGSSLLFNRVPFFEVHSQVPYFKETEVVIRTVYPTLALPPPITITLIRYLTSGWAATVMASSGTWSLPFWPLNVPDLSVRLSEDKESGELHFKVFGLTDEPEELEKDDGTGTATLPLPRTVTAALMSGFKPRPASLNVSLASVHTPGLPGRISRMFAMRIQDDLNCQVSGQWSGWFSAKRLIHKVLPLEIEEEVHDFSNAGDDHTFVSTKVGWKVVVHVGLLTGLGASSSLSGRLGRASWGLSVDYGNSGVWLRLRFGTLGQKLTLPIWLIEEKDPVFAVSTAAVIGTAVMSCFTVHELWQLRNKHR